MILESMSTAKTDASENDCTDRFNGRGGNDYRCHLHVLPDGEEGDRWTGRQAHLVTNEPWNMRPPVGQRPEAADSLLHSAVRRESAAPLEDVQHAACSVCGDKANGNFFGATVCLPCKSFFIRCTKEGEPAIQKQCNGCCDVSKELRNRCQFCRFQRCLLIGMTRREKPVVVYAREGQELCRVCGDLANGVHFGIFTCEGCKKFFRRGLKEHKAYMCRGSQDCQLNPRNRNNCRACRFRKCAEVGMSRDAIKMGRPRKAFGQARTDADQLGMSSMFSREVKNDNTQTCDFVQLPATPAGTPQQMPLPGPPPLAQPDARADKGRYPTWSPNVPCLSWKPEEDSHHQWLAKSERCSAEPFCGEPLRTDQEQMDRGQPLSDAPSTSTFSCLTSELASRPSLSRGIEHKTFRDVGPYGALCSPNAPPSSLTQPLHVNSSIPSEWATPNESEFHAPDETDYCSFQCRCDQTHYEMSAPCGPHPDMTLFAASFSHRVPRACATEGVLDLSNKASAPKARQETSSAHACNHRVSPIWRRSCPPPAEEGMTALITGTGKGSEAVYEPRTAEGPDRGIKIARMSTEGIHAADRRSSNGGPGWAAQSRPTSEPTGCSFLSSSDRPIDLSGQNSLTSCGNMSETRNTALCYHFANISPSSRSFSHWSPMKNSSEYFDSPSSNLRAKTLSFLQPEKRAVSNLTTDVNGVSNRTQLSTDVLNYSRCKSANKHSEVVVMNEFKTVSQSSQSMNVRHAAEWCPENSQHCLGTFRQTNSSRFADGYRSNPSEYFQELVPDQTRRQEVSQGHYFMPSLKESEKPVLNGVYAGVHKVSEGSEQPEISDLKGRTVGDTNPSSEIQMVEELLQNKFDVSLVRLREYWHRRMKLSGISEPGQSDVREIPDICRLIIKDLLTYEEVRNGANETLDVNAKCPPQDSWGSREAEQNWKASTLRDAPPQPPFAFRLPGCLQGDQAALSKEEQDSSGRQDCVGEQVVALLRRYADCLEWLERVVRCRNKKLPDRLELEGAVCQLLVCPQESLEACGTEALRAAPQLERGCTASRPLPCASRKRRYWRTR